MAFSQNYDNAQNLLGNKVNFLGYPKGKFLCVRSDS